ncbi:MAG: sodium:calcium antiporter [Pseudomonadota bacterium]|nr:sodium:calcium antiporter [Pseudomonadota bacterium]
MIAEITDSLSLTVVSFVLSGFAVLLAGLKLTEIAERLAALTGLGQAVLGAVFLGATTSLSGTVTSVTAALSGQAELAYGNAIGGIAAQTTFLVIADMLYRGVNLEHAAASEENLLQGVLLVVLLAIPLTAMSGPGVTVLGLDVASIAIVVMYVFGIRLVSMAHDSPMWSPRQTAHTAPSESDETPGTDSSQTHKLWFSFCVLAAIVAVAGWLIAQTGMALAERTGISQTVVGNLLTSTVTSLPELVVAIAAVRRGALALAVGDILGGNAFDVLFLVLSDIAWREGSIHLAVSDKQALWLGLSIIMVGVMLLGMLRRQRHGIANIGFEGVLVLLLYGAGVSMIVLG